MQKRPLLLPVVIVIVGFFDIGFAIKYAQLTVPSFPGGPVPSVELRPFLLMMSLVVLSVPLGFWFAGGREIELLQKLTDQAEKERSFAQYMEKRLKDRLSRIQAEKDEQQRVFSELKQMIITNVSHELRTPITVVLGYLQMIMSGAFGEIIGTPMGVPLGAASTATKRMKIIVDRMVLPLRDPYFRIFSLSDICLSVIEDEDTWLGTRRSVGDVAINSRVSKEIKVFGDEQMLRMVMFELVHNAIKFGANRITVGLDRQEEYVVFSVSDDGVGISQKFHNKIFEPLYQVRMDSTRPFEGAGMGLAVVSEVVLIHDGFVNVDSRLHQGATFTLGIPVPQNSAVLNAAAGNED